MREVFVDTAIVVLGAAVMALRKALAHDAVKRQNQLFGLNFGQREERTSTWAFLFIGAGFVVVGVLQILGVG